MATVISLLNAETEEVPAVVQTYKEKMEALLPRNLRTVVLHPNLTVGSRGLTGMNTVVKGEAQMIPELLGPSCFTGGVSATKVASAAGKSTQAYLVNELASPAMKQRIQDALPLHTDLPTESKPDLYSQPNGAEWSCALGGGASHAGIYVADKCTKEGTWITEVYTVANSDVPSVSNELKFFAKDADQVVSEFVNGREAINARKIGSANRHKLLDALKVATNLSSSTPIPEIEQNTFDADRMDADGNYTFNRMVAVAAKGKPFLLACDAGRGYKMVTNPNYSSICEGNPMGLAPATTGHITSRQEMKNQLNSIIENGYGHTRNAIVGSSVVWKDTSKPNLHVANRYRNPDKPEFLKSIEKAGHIWNDIVSLRPVLTIVAPSS